MKSPLKTLLMAACCMAVAALLSVPAFAGTPVPVSTGKGKIPVLAPPPSAHGWYIRAGGAVEFPVEGEFLSRQTALVRQADLNFDLNAFRDLDLGPELDLFFDPELCIHPDRWFDLDTFLDLNADPNLVSVPIVIGSIDWDDIYDDMVGGNIQFGRYLGTKERTSVYLGVGYIEGDANARAIGTFAGQPIRAQFDDYKSWRAYGGVRYDLTTGKQLTPYVGAHVGASFTNGIDASLSIPTLGARLGNTRIYDNSTVIFTGATAGVSYALTRDFDIGIESGFNYQGSLDSAGTFFGARELANANDGDGFFSIPVQVYGQYRF